jgi:putative endonuclease
MTIRRGAVLISMLLKVRSEGSGMFLCVLPPLGVILGLVPRTQGAAHYNVEAEGKLAEFTYYVYLLASDVRGTLYIGVTNSLLFRIAQHRAGKGGVFTRKYGVTRLVWFEEHGDINDAIQREKSLKRYQRDWKFNLVERDNPYWDDLYPELQVKFGVSDEF